MGMILKCPKCGKTYPVTDQSELTGKNYCSDCEVELTLVRGGSPQPVQPAASAKTAGVPAMTSVINIADAPAEVQAAFKTKPLQIANKYIIVKKLGQGGMGAVYQGWDTSLRRYVALKVILSSKDDPSIKEDALKRFIREAQTAAKLAHPNILQVYEVGPYKSSYFICMEYVDGGTLDSYWSNKHQPSSQTGSQRGRRSSLKRPALQDIKEYLQMMRRVSEGIDYAHSQGIIHRDIKPENVLLQKRGEIASAPPRNDSHCEPQRGAAISTIIPKVADFGLAKEVMSEKKLTMAGTVVGTPLYMSPEQATALKLDVRSDVFSLGSVIYKLCTGAEPFMGKSSLDVMKAVVTKEPIPPGRLNRAIDRDLEIIILKAMEKEKERRYQTARELAEDIERYLKGETIRARPASVIYKITKTVKRNKVAFAGATIGAVLLIILITVIVGIYEKGSVENLVAQGYLEDADEYYGKKDYARAKEAYTKYLTLVKADEDAQDKLKECEKLIAEKERLAKEALDDAQNAWLYAAQIFPEFYKPKADMDRVWQQIDKAIRMLDDSLRKQPNPTGYFYRGLLYREKAEPEKAIKDFTAAIEQDGDFQMAYVLRGTVYFEQYTELLSGASGGESGVHQEVSEELVEKARDDFDKSQEIKTDKYARITEQFRKYTKLFEAAIWSRKDSQKCIKLLEEGYKEHKSEDFLYWLGVMKSQSNIEAAVKYLQEALEMKPQYARVFWAKGNIKQVRKDLDGAIEDFNTAIKINPNFAMVYNNRGIAKEAKGDLGGAIADYNSAIKLNPNYNAAYGNRGIAKYENGDLDGAIADFSSAIKLNPKHAEAYNNRGLAKKDKNDLDGAIADFSIVINLNPNLASAYTNRGVAKYNKGDLDGAFSDWNTAIRLDPNDTVVYNNRGNAKYERGDLDGAIADYNIAIKLNPNYASAYANRGNAKSQKAERESRQGGINSDAQRELLKGALADFEAAARLDPAFKNRLGPVIENIKRKLKK